MAATNIYSMTEDVRQRIKDVSSEIFLVILENIAGQNKRERYLIKGQKLNPRNIGKKTLKLRKLTVFSRRFSRRKLGYRLFSERN